MTIQLFSPRYRDDLLFMVLSAKDALGLVPTLREAYTLKAKSPVKWTMVYPKKKTYSDKQTEITFTVEQPDTVIFVIKP